MRTRALAICVVGLLLAADEPKKEDVKKELDGLKGKWVVTAMVRDGMKSEEATGDVVTFDGDKVTVKTKTTEHSGMVKLDPRKKPKAVDFIPLDGPAKDKPHPGILELTGDTLRICYAEPGKDRPKEFDSKPGMGLALVTMKRDKAK